MGYGWVIVPAGDVASPHSVVQGIEASTDAPHLKDIFDHAAFVAGAIHDGTPPWLGPGHNFNLRCVKALYDRSETLEALPGGDDLLGFMHKHGFVMQRGQLGEVVTHKIRDSMLHRPGSLVPECGLEIVDGLVTRQAQSRKRLLCHRAGSLLGHILSRAMLSAG